jgi:hypothetical protein
LRDGAKLREFRFSVVGGDDLLNFKRGKKSDRSKIIAKLDVVVSKAVRDRDGVCQYCKKSSTTYNHHIFARRHLGTRFDMENCISLCVYCHRFIAHGDPEKFRDFIISWMGEDRFERLKIKAYSTTKFSGVDLEWLLKDLRHGRDDEKIVRECGL